jgi:hypothetical protein
MSYAPLLPKPQGWGTLSLQGCATRPEAQQVALCVLVKTKEPRIEWHVSKRDAGHLAEYLAKVRIVAEDIARGKFYKRPGKWSRTVISCRCAWGIKRWPRRSW